MTRKSLKNKIKDKVIPISIVALVLLTIFGIIVAHGAQGSVSVEKDPESPSRNIANVTDTYVPILYLKFEASGESANITAIKIKEIGSIHGTSGITGVGVSNSSTNLGPNTRSKDIFSGDDGDATLYPNEIVDPGTPKTLYIWVNISGTGFQLGQNITLQLTEFNATGLASESEVSKTGTPVTSNVIYGAGKLNLTRGFNDTYPSYVDAGKNTTGIVIMQLNFTSEIEGSKMKNVTLRENGTANATKDISAVYLVNDTDRDGNWNRTATGADAEKIITTIVQNPFTSDNGTVTLEMLTTGVDTEKTIPLNKSRNYLVVVNTTKWFWSGETLVFNVTDFNATGDSDQIVGKYVSGNLIEDVSELRSNATTGQSRIITTAGERQPFFSFIKLGDNKNIENLQVKFTAIAGKVNITAIMLSQLENGNVPGNTTPKIYWDVDKDGNATSIDKLISNVTGNFTMETNETLGNYNISLGGTNFTNTNFTYKFSGGKLIDNATAMYVYIRDLDNITGSGPWWYNVSIEYINESSILNTTYFNASNMSGPYVPGTGFPLPSNAIGNYYPVEIGSDDVHDIVNVSFVASQSVNKTDFDILVTTNYAVVPLATNLSIGFENETNSTTGQSSEYVIIAVNTSSGFASEYKTKAALNNSTKYGNWSNYISFDTKLNRQIYNGNNTSTSAAKSIQATTITGNAYLNVTKGLRQPIANVGINETLVSVLQLNFSLNAPNLGVADSISVGVYSLVISTNGSANESSNITIGLVEDGNDNGIRDSTESLISETKSLDSDNATVMLNTTITLTATGTNKLVYKNILVVVNTSRNLNINDTLWFNLTNPSIDYTAIAGTAPDLIALIDYNETTIAGEQLYAVGSISAELGSKTPIAGNVSSEVDLTYLPLMQLNFTASDVEDVNITGITITWNGSKTNPTGIRNVTVINDTNNNGIYDSVDTILNSTDFSPVFTNSKVWLNLTPNGNLIVRKGTTANMLITVNTTSSNLDNDETLAINISNPYTDYNATGISSGRNITDYNTSTISSAIKTAKFTGIINVYGIPLATNKVVKGAQSNVTLLGLRFNATKEDMDINWIKINASGTVNEANNITNIRLVNDTNENGAYDVGVDSIIPTTSTPSITSENGNATLYPSPPIVVNAVVGYRKILFIADITDKFEPGQWINFSLQDPKTDYKATGNISGRSVEDPSTTPITNTTYIIGAISASIGSNTPSGSVSAMRQSNVSLMQINFSATYESMNITRINITWAGSANATQNLTGVGVVNDLDGDGQIDSGEPRLNITTFDANGTAMMTLVSSNVSLGNYSTSTTTGPTGAENFTDGYEVAGGVISIWAHVTNLMNYTTPWHYNTSINYTNLTGYTKTVYFNITNVTVGNGTANNTWHYIDVGTDGVTDIINITNVSNSSAYVISFNITATNLTTVPKASYTNAIIFVNTSDTFRINQTLQAKLVNPSANYSAIGIDSGQTINDTSTTDITSNALTGTGNITVTKGLNDTQTRNINISTTSTKVVLWQLNITAGIENVTINNITLTENGTANGATDISKVYLYYDANGDGYINTSESSVANGTLSTDNGTVLLSLSGNNTIANGASKNYLVAVDTVISSSFTDGETLAFNLTSTGVKATGENSSMLVYNNYSTLSSNITTGVGSIELTKGSTQPTVIFASQNNYRGVLQLIFNAPNGPINVDNITVKENGTATPSTDFTNISIINDTDGDGKYDSGEVFYNSTAWITSDNGVVVINTSGLVVNGTYTILVAVNTTGNISAGDILRFEVNQTLGVGYNATGNVSRLTPYSINNGTINNSITVSGGFGIDLIAGWNLISLPLIPNNDSIENVTSEIRGNIAPNTSIWWYDTLNSKWKSYNPEKPVNTLTKMTAGEDGVAVYSYWINMAQRDTLVVNGSFWYPKQIPPTYPVYTGWNMIGFHSKTNINASEYLAGLTWTSMYQYQNEEYTRISPSDTMYRGYGYWLYVPSNGTIVI